MIKKAVFLKTIPENKKELLNLSVSKVKTFKSCKAKFYFNYIKRLPKKEWDFQIFGSFLHEVLERFETFIINGNSDPDNKIMKVSYANALKGVPFEGTDRPTIWSEKLTKDQKDECFKILCQFLERRAILKKEGKLPKTIQAEKSFHILIEDGILLNGFIDVVQMDPDNVLHVADYKTSKHKKFLQKDFLQLKTYAYAMCLEDPNLQLVRCSYVMLKHNFDLITTEFKREDLMTSTEQYIEFANSIKSEKLFRPTVGPLCGYCDYLDHCDAGKKKMGLSRNSFGETKW